MTQGVVLSSLSELAQVRELFADEAGAVPEERALVPVIGGSGPEEIEALAATARQALDELEALLASDGEHRLEAERGLGRVRAAAAEAARLRRTARELGDAAERAAQLAESAFEPAARQRAERIAATGGRLANQAEAHAAVLEHEAQALAGREDVARLLAEEQIREQEVRMREELALAWNHLDGGRTEEARRLLDSVEQKISSVPDLREAFETLRRRERAVKIRTAEAALREARRRHRREPAQAIRADRAGRAGGLAGGTGTPPLRLLAHRLPPARAAGGDPLPGRVRPRGGADPHRGRPAGRSSRRSASGVGSAAAASRRGRCAVHARSPDPGQPRARRTGVGPPAGGSHLVLPARGRRRPPAGPEGAGPRAQAIKQ